MTMTFNMTFKLPFVVVPAALLSLGATAALAGETFQQSGALGCIIDKWNEKEVEKGHKLVDSAIRCAVIPDDPNEEKVFETCSGKYEYKPDESWKGSGICTDTYKDGSTIVMDWEEGSHLKEYTYNKTGGTGKYKGVAGGGKYTYDNINDSFSGGRYKGTLTMP